MSLGSGSTEGGRKPETLTVGRGETAEPRPVMHAAQFCPNCSAQLKEHRCKMSCPQCGFYLSCSDFY
jgi:hypothetical protein